MEERECGAEDGGAGDGVVGAGIRSEPWEIDTQSWASCLGCLGWNRSNRHVFPLRKVTSVGELFLSYPRNRYVSLESQTSLAISICQLFTQTKHRLRISHSFILRSFDLETRKHSECRSLFLFLLIIDNEDILTQTTESHCQLSPTSNAPMKE